MLKQPWGLCVQKCGDQCNLLVCNSGNRRVDQFTLEGCFTGKTIDSLQDPLYIFSSCFHKKLASFNPNRIRNWTKGVNIFWKEYVIIPVCTGTHWMLVIVKMNRGDGVSIMILDAANRPSVRSNKIHRRSVERLVKNYLRDEWAAKATLKKKKYFLWGSDLP